jgi:hypothetical protein
LLAEDDKERGYHYHCEKSEVFCKDKGNKKQDIKFIEIN